MVLLGEMAIDAVAEKPLTEGHRPQVLDDAWDLQATSIEPISAPVPLEGIYFHIFQKINPTVSLGEVQIRFRKYANANSRIRLQGGCLFIDISDVLQNAPLNIHEALAAILISKLFRRVPDRRTVERYRRYLNATEMRRRLHGIKQSRGRKVILDPAGSVYDLRGLFDELNLRYFHGLMAQPTLGWSLKRSASILGHYDPSHHAIVLNSMLDSREAPALAVRYVLFHEMLHIQFPVEHRGGRRCVHTREFKEAEKQFENYKDAQRNLKQFVEGIVRTAAKRS